MAGRITITGEGRFKDAIELLIRNAPEASKDAIREELKIEMQESMRRTPVKRGWLRDSHRLLEPEIRGKRIRGSISVGDDKTRDYAVIQHEDLFLHHDNGQAKFLSSTLLESRPFMGARLARRLQIPDIVQRNR